eukprot:CAMPEP_0176416680 /NCGR_PEP_ID=MMETSP0127-20121128/6475_1 /TAXON_ID=938130 /ORGANISM="Platyophrya macrostoma, Strain WH" /LENGTH=280 /DNA_ID=CAMNT_0017796771 /DNA_START=76 /DNA_END=918 /DNA_ORIENTATION=-
MTSVLFCVKGDAAAVDAVVKSVTGHVSIASELKKKGQYNVFLHFAAEEAAATASEVLRQNPNVTLAGEKKATTSGDASAAATVGKKKQKQLATNAAATYFNYESYDQMRERKDTEARIQAAVERKKERRQQQAATQQQHSDGAEQPQHQQGRGGRGGAFGGRGGRRGGRGGFHGRQRVPMIQGFVAVLDNVPFSTTNDQIARLFMTCGAIYDINRLETMAMVYFDSAEAVQRAILTMNGQKIQNSIITVSSGGCVRVPAPVVPAPPAQQMPPPAAAPPAQ